MIAPSRLTTLDVLLRQSKESYITNLSCFRFRFLFRQKYVDEMAIINLIHTMTSGADLLVNLVATSNPKNASTLQKALPHKSIAYEA